ncbi:AEC family transporter [Proteocatella sphenisci]|uniref:AEC family transporter n=1 Tax=Proteocatella sphenisci TaxID=181070 RepID=UPI00048AAF34|nr:AEC family transporter [Proteocatella sphenisci]
MNFYLIFSKVSVIFLLILVGFFLSKRRILSSEGQRELTSLLLYVLLPCTLIKSFDIEYSYDILTRGLKMSFFMFGMYIISYFLAKFISGKYAEPENRKDIHVLSMILPNVGFMGYPIINALIGPDAIIYAVMCNMGFEFFAWTVGINTVSKNSPVKVTENPVFSLLKTPAILAILTGMVLFTTPLYIPEPLISTVNLLAGAMSPVAMIIVGISLANSNLSNIIKNKYIYISSLVRLFAIPLITMLILKLISAENLSYTIPLILISMPTAGYATMFATKYENDSLLASEIISMSTLISLISIPLILSLM